MTPAAYARRRWTTAPEHLEPRLPLAAASPTVTIGTVPPAWSDAIVLEGRTVDAPRIHVSLAPVTDRPATTSLSLARATQPRLTTSVTTESFQVLVAVSRAGTPLAADAAVVDPTQGVATITVRTAAGAIAYRLELSVRARGETPESLVGLNPQPEPPSGAGAAVAGVSATFAAAARAGLTLTVTDASDAPLALARRVERPLGAGQTLPVWFTLSEPSRSFTATDVAVAGGTLSQFAGSGSSYTAVFTPAADSVAPGRIEVAAGAFTDLQGVENRAGGLPVPIDTRPPVVSITAAVPAQPLGAGAALPLVFTLSEPVSGFTAADVQVTGGRITGFAGRGTRYTARFVPDTDAHGAGQVTVPAGGLTDAAGNTNPYGGLATAIPIDTRPRSLTAFRDRATIQEAVDAVADGGTVRIPPGTYDAATNPIRIVGKVVHLVGMRSSDGNRPLIRGTSRPVPVRTLADAVGLVGYGPGGGGRLENLVLEGGDAGVAGTAAGPSSPGAVTLQNVLLTGNGRGLAGTFQRLSVRNSLITKATLHGVSLLLSGINGAAVSFANSTVGNCGSFGMRIESLASAAAPLSVVIDKATISGNGGGGAILIGPLSVTTTQSSFIGNAQVGFWCSEIATTGNLFFKNVVSGTTIGAGAALPMGHGVVVAKTGGIAAVLSTFQGNAKAGMLVAMSGAAATLKGCTVTGNLFGVVAAEDGVATNVNNSSTVKGNASEDWMSDKALDVPGPPAIPPE